MLLNSIPGCCNQKKKYRQDSGHYTIVFTDFPFTIAISSSVKPYSSNTIWSISFSSAEVPVVGVLEENYSNDAGKEFCPAFILLDLNMPMMDGFEFLEAFQGKYAACSGKITVCILSSSSAVKDQQKALQYPISGFIIKPLTEEKLKPILEIL